MSVSSGFLDSLDKVLLASDESCTCEFPGLYSCKSCEAKDLIDRIYTQINDFVGKYK